ncbi:hypothetical protein SLE2022_333290 [Rubroshorea leprosula]
MPSDRSFLTTRRGTLIDEREFYNRAKCLTFEVGNKILVEHLDSFGEADHLILLDELPTLHEAQPALTSLESLEAIDLGDDPTDPKHVHISTTLFVDKRVKMIDFLWEYKNVFT